MSFQNKIQSLQVLRAVAALMVVLHHIPFTTGNVSLDAAVFVDLGAFGVDIFFVLSGFIIYLSATRVTGDVGGFLMRRLIRIAPAYWLLTTSLAMAIVAAPGIFTSLSVDWPHYIASMLFIPHPSPGGTPYPLLFVGWSLSYELYFYAVFASVLSLPAAHRVAALTFFFVASAAIGLALPAAHGPLVDMATDSLILEFLIGVLLAHIANRISARPWVAAASVMAGISIAFVLAPSAAESAFRGLLWGIPAAMIVAGAWMARECEAPRAWLSLGDASYSLYLVHAIMVPVVVRMMNGAPQIVVAITAVSASIAAAFAMWWYFERPAGQYLRAWFERPSLSAATPQ